MSEWEENAKKALINRDTSFKVTENFTIAELIASDVASQEKIDNFPSDGNQPLPGLQVLTNLFYLCQNVLEPVYAKFGDKLTLKNVAYRGDNSVFRCSKLNSHPKVGSSEKSQHLKGQAADFEVEGMSNMDLAKWCEANLTFDQLILEYWREGQPSSGWVHCSYAGDPRKQVLTASKGGRYFNGLIAA
jgi:hypothetical protein